MYRTHTCGELRMSNVNESITLSGWVDTSRDLGGMTFIDLRDRYGITQLVFDEQENADLAAEAQKLGREFVIRINGTVRERSNKNPNRDTGDIEIQVQSLDILNASDTPPFTIEEETDGGEELRMKYRYLDLRRPIVRDNLIFRSQVGIETRKYLAAQGFIEIETPYLIKSTPEGARDFLVPSRMNHGQFYALPQSPQTFKQILMVGGMDKYFQIVKCFRDEDLRNDRQPEFTQIDCEMSFVSQEEIIQTFEGLARHLFKELLGKDIGAFPRMTYNEAMKKYGSDKPDLRMGLEFCELNDVAQGKGFNVFDKVELVVGIAAPGAASYTRKQLDALTDWVKRPQIGANGLVYVKCNEDGTYKSSVDKFFDQEALGSWHQKMGGKPGDLLLVLAGAEEKTQKQLCELRLHIGEQLGLLDPFNYKPLWVVDMPLLEWDEESERFHAMHHPFTSPKPEFLEDIKSRDRETLRAIRSDAYDLVLNGAEVAGGSIRIHNREIQDNMFELLGFSKEEAQEQFGFLLGAFKYGAPPHGGLAFGFDRFVSVNQGRDVMIDSPASIDAAQYQELGLALLKRDDE